MAPYDVFVSYPSGERETAEQLATALSIIGVKVFFDVDSIVPGDCWTESITSAQKSALLTVVLVSPDSDSAYYQREEVLGAIELSRQNQMHRVVPVYLRGTKPPEKVPLGLKQLHGIFLDRCVNILDVAQKIEAALQMCRSYAGIGEPPANSNSRAERLRERARNVRTATRRSEAITALQKLYKSASDSSVATLVYLDLDDFTVINRRFGELVGDAIVRFVEDLLDSTKCFQWGGDEFIVGLLEVDGEDAERLAERWRLEIAGNAWHKVAPGLHATASFGIAELNESDTMESWLLRAIFGCDQAKREGKNSVGSAPLSLPKEMITELDRIGSDP